MVGLDQVLGTKRRGQSEGWPPLSSGVTMAVADKVIVEINCPYCGRITHTSECGFCHIAKHMAPEVLRKIATMLDKIKKIEKG